MTQLLVSGYTAPLCVQSDGQCGEGRCPRHTAHPVGPSRGFRGCSEQVRLESTEAPPHSTACRKVAGNLSVPQEVRWLEAVTCADVCMDESPTGLRKWVISCWTGVSWSVFIRCWPSSRWDLEKCAVMVSNAPTSASGHLTSFFTHPRKAVRPPVRSSLSPCCLLIQLHGPCFTNLQPLMVKPLTCCLSVDSPGKTPIPGSRPCYSPQPVCRVRQGKEYGDLSQDPVGGTAEMRLTLVSA